MIRLGLFLTFIPQLLWAQTAVPIQSGEHDDFTRLVLTIDPDSNWELLETRGKITLTFPVLELDFETSDIFDTIPKTRILSAQGVAGQDGSTLTLDIPCDCPTNVFAFGSRHLVIDIKNGGPLPEIVVEQDLREPPPAYAYWQPEMLTATVHTDQPDFFQAPELVEIIAQPTIVADIPVQEPEQMEPNFDAIDVIGAKVPRAATEPDAAMLARIAEAQKQLLQQLTRAADQGLIDFVPPVATVAEPEMQIDLAEEAAEEDLPPDPTLLNQLTARTAYDDAAESDLAAIINEFAMPQCLDNADFDMQDWRSGFDFSAQVAALRTQMYGEFDVLDVDAAVNLAKLYIVNGLGAEAEAILAGLPEQSKNTSLLMGLAAIVDGKHWPATGQIAKGENCGGDHEMWFLAGGQGRPVIIDIAPVIAAFSRYPINIRLLIGPRLANTMLDVGEFDAAHQVLEIVRRAAPPETASMQLASANFLESTDEQIGAVQLYSDVAMSQETEANFATIALARAAISHDDGIAESLLTDLEAIVFAQRDTEIGAEARLWEIQVNARINGLAAGLEMIALDISLSSKNAAELDLIATDLFLNANADQQGHLAFADTILAFQHLLPLDKTADKARVHIANELVKIGLPNIGLAILEPAISHQNPDAELAAANAYLAQFEPDLALDVIAEHHSEAAITVALSAYLLKSDHGAIAKILNDPANAGLVENEIAWRAGDWQNIQGDDADATMAAFMQGRALTMPIDVDSSLSNENAFLTGVVIDEEPNLRAARNLLEVNRASRAFIEDVLAEE